MEFKHIEYFVKVCLYKSMLQAVCFFTALHKAAYSPMFIVLLYPDAFYAFREKPPDIALEILDCFDTEVMYTLRASGIKIFLLKSTVQRKYLQHSYTTFVGKTQIQAKATCGIKSTVVLVQYA